MNIFENGIYVVLRFWEAATGWALWLIPFFILKYWFWHDTETAQMTRRKYESAKMKENKCKEIVKEVFFYQYKVMSICS